MHWSSLLIVMLAAACVGSAPDPLTRPGARETRQQTECAVREDRALCRFGRGEPVRELSNQALATVPRFGGGAFVLERDGGLLRFDRRGDLSGRTSDILGEAAQPMSILGAERFLCAVSEDGRVACAFDRFFDLTCPTAPFAPEFRWVATSSAHSIYGTSDEPIVGIIDQFGQRQLFELGLSCAGHCISLGCDSPLHCIDPCPEGELSRVVARQGEGWSDFFSNRAAARVTHPLK